jgi:hypothetical protein
MDDGGPDFTSPRAPVSGGLRRTSPSRNLGRVARNSATSVITYGAASAFAIVGLFVLTWAVALTVWRVGRIEEKWSNDADLASRAE